MNLTFLAIAVLVYAVLQIVALRVTTGPRWRLSLGVAIPAASCSIVGTIGVAFGVDIAPLYFLLFAPIGAGVLAIILGAHVLDEMRRR